MGLPDSLIASCSLKPMPVKHYLMSVSRPLLTDTSDFFQAFDHCSNPLGPLCQNLFSCLKCNPPPVSHLSPTIPQVFVKEDDFEGFICYKCVNANPWIKSYAGSPGFLMPVFRKELPQPLNTIEKGLRRRHSPDRRNCLLNSSSSDKEKMEVQIS